MIDLGIEWMIGIFGKVTLRGLDGNFELYSDLQIPHLDRIGCNLVRPEKIGWSEKTTSNCDSVGFATELRHAQICF